VVGELEGVVQDLLDNPALDYDPALKALRQVGGWGGVCVWGGGGVEAVGGAGVTATGYKEGT
jgi:hypothetical protein